MTQQAINDNQQEQDFKLDLEEGTITYCLDRDLNKWETVRLSELFEMLAWFRSRETDLRYMVQDRYPKVIRQLMHRQGNYMIGVTADRQRVKIDAQAWNKIAEDRERIYRENWLFAIKDRKKTTVQIDMLDNTGKPLPRLDTEEVLTIADCPDYEVRQELDKLLDPVFWVYRPENLDYGKSVKWQ